MTGTPPRSSICIISDVPQRGRPETTIILFSIDVIHPPACALQRGDQSHTKRSAESGVRIVNGRHAPPHPALRHPKSPGYAPFEAIRWSEDSDVHAQRAT